MARYVLGDHEFPSKKAATAEIRRILNGSTPGVPLAGDDAALVSLLLTAGKHPEAAAKIGSGIAELIVGETSIGTRCFWIRRVDGTTVDFSYRACLDGAPSARAEVSAALRAEVSDQIAAHREEAGEFVMCGLCGTDLVTADGEVDHVDPLFSQMVTRFLDIVGSPESLEIECPDAWSRRLADRGLAQVWQLYHLHTASLRVVCPDCNHRRNRVVA